MGFKLISKLYSAFPKREKKQTKKSEHQTNNSNDDNNRKNNFISITSSSVKCELIAPSLDSAHGPPTEWTTLHSVSLVLKINFYTMQSKYKSMAVSGAWLKKERPLFI